MKYQSRNGLVEAHSLQQCPETRIRSHVIQQGINFDPHDPNRLFLERSLQPLEGSVFVPQAKFIFRELTSLGLSRTQQVLRSRACESRYAMLRAPKKHGPSRIPPVDFRSPGFCREITYCKRRWRVQAPPQIFPDRRYKYGYFAIEECLRVRLLPITLVGQSDTLH